MQRENGYTLIEVAVTMLIVTLLSGSAVLSGVGLLSRVRVSRTTTAMGDNVSFSRERAMAQYQRWMLVFPAPLSGSDAVTQYQIASCDLSARACDPSIADDWVFGPNSTISPEPGIGFQVLQPISSPPAPIQIVFDRTGRFMGPVDVDLKICVTRQTGSGALTCRPGAASKSVRIRKVSGIIHPLP